MRGQAARVWVAIRPRSSKVGEEERPATVRGPFSFRSVRTGEGEACASSQAVGGFVEVPGEVDLALVVGFVPGEEHDGLADGAAAVGRADNAGELGRGAGGDVGFEVGAGGVEQFADLGEGGDVGIRWGGAAAEGLDELGISGRAALDHDVEVFVVGGGAVHGLPGDVGPAGAGTPGKDGLRILAGFLDGFEDGQEAGAGEVGGGDEGGGVHAVSLVRL